MPQPTRTPREQLHHKIRNEFVARIADYYARNAELLKNPGHDEGIKALLALMDGVLSVIDAFEISDKKTNTEGKTQ